MSKSVEPGTKVFGVYEGWHGPTIQAGTVGKVSAKKILLSDSDLAFGCRRQFNREHDFAQTPAAAWEQWKASLRQLRADLIKKIDQIDAKLDLPLMAPGTDK